MKKRYMCKYKNLQTLWINAENTSEAGKLAVAEYTKMGNHGIDEFSIDVQEAKPTPFTIPAFSPAYTGGYPTGGTLPGLEDNSPPGAVPQQPIGDDEDTPILDPWSDIAFLFKSLGALRS